MIILITGHVTIETGKTIANLQKIPSCIMEPEVREIKPPKDEPFIIRRQPDIEQPLIVSIKEAEEPFYKRFDKRRGKRKNRR